MERAKLFTELLAADLPQAAEGLFLDVANRYANQPTAALEIELQAFWRIGHELLPNNLTSDHPVIGALFAMEQQQDYLRGLGLTLQEYPRYWQPFSPSK